MAPERGQEPPQGAGLSNPDHDGVNLIKRCVTLITHNPPDAENANPNASPPVSSTRRSPSPVETIDLDDVSTTSRSASGSSGGGLGLGLGVGVGLGGGPIRTRTPKPSGMCGAPTSGWRPPCSALAWRPKVTTLATAAAPASPGRGTPRHFEGVDGTHKERSVVVL